jgi:hypothetical protein
MLSALNKIIAAVLLNLSVSFVNDNQFDRINPGMVEQSSRPYLSSRLIHVELSFFNVSATEYLRDLTGVIGLSSLPFGQLQYDILFDGVRTKNTCTDTRHEGDEDNRLKWVICESSGLSRKEETIIRSHDRW